jgi:hypothetical protein
MNEVHSCEIIGLELFKPHGMFALPIEILIDI